MLNNFIDLTYDQFYSTKFILLDTKFITHAFTIPKSFFTESKVDYGKPKI